MGPGSFCKQFVFAIGQLGIIGNALYLKKIPFCVFNYK